MQTSAFTKELFKLLAFQKDINRGCSNILERPGSDCKICPYLRIMLQSIGAVGVYVVTNCTEKLCKSMK